MDTPLTTTEQTVLALMLAALGICSRLLPHAPDATMLTTVIFAGMLYLKPRSALLLTLSVLLISDMFIGGYEMPVLLSVYGSFLAIAALGWLFSRRRSLMSRTLLLASASLLFFLVTNAAVWFFTPWYPKDLSGLMLSYAMGLPFLRNMFLGDIIYTPALLGVLALCLRLRSVQLRPSYAS